MSSDGALSGARALVTGGAGFIGSHLVDALIDRGCDVVVLDNFSSGSRDNLAQAKVRGKLRIIEGSILDREILAGAIGGCSHVFHLAVECVRRSLGAPIANHDVNATGSLYVLEAARMANVRRFVYCSSSEVYGNYSRSRLNEGTAVCAPVTVYGAAKLAGEHYTHAYRQTYGVPSTIVRPFNAYGPREHERGDLAEVIPRFVIRVLNDLPPIIFGDGTNGRDFTYVTEIANGILRAGECDAMIGRVANLAYGRMITVADVAKHVAIACDRPDLVPAFMNARPGDVVALEADTALAQELLDFKATIGLQAGLRRYVDWFRETHDDVASLLEDEPANWTL